MGTNGNNDLTLAGDIADFDLAEIIQMICRAGKTGKLIISGHRNYVTLYFKEGRLVFASPAHRRDYLGNLLIRRGVVSQKDVERALTVQRRLRRRGHNVRIGSILAAKGVISSDDLRELIRRQLEETFSALLDEQGGRFEFTPEFELDDGDVLVSIDAVSILMENARQLEEARAVGKAVTGPGVI